MKAALDYRSFSLSAYEAYDQAQLFHTLSSDRKPSDQREGLYVLFPLFCQKKSFRKENRVTSQPSVSTGTVSHVIPFSYKQHFIECDLLLALLFSYQNYFKSFYETLYFLCCLFFIDRDNRFFISTLTYVSLILFSSFLFLSKITYTFSLLVTYYLVSQNYQFIIFIVYKRHKLWTQIF